jgi:D-alanyl-D-alanine carboxypeptidase
MAKPSELLAAAPAASEPIPVYTGPTRTGTALIAAVAMDAEKQTTRPHGKKSRVAAKKPDASDAKDAGTKPEPKSTAKPSAVRHANAKSDASPKAAEKPAAATDKPAAKPKAAAKPSGKPAAPKNTTGEATTPPRS